MGLQFEPRDYKTHVRMSGRRHLLVEGKSDKYLFKLLVDEINNPTCGIDIDTAEDLIKFGGKLGNRERVEAICEMIKDIPDADRFAGFVDREFREFEDEKHLTDKMPCHNILNRLVWSRGHSIENYYFDFDMLTSSFKIFTDADYFTQALDLLKFNFENVIRYACSASLSGRDTGLLSVIPDSPRRDFFEFNSDHLTFNLTRWKVSLLNKNKINQEKADQIIDRYQYWYEFVQAANFDVVRWMCHGHTGFNFIWTAYAACVFEVCQRSNGSNCDKQAHSIFKSDSMNKFNTCASFYVKRAIGNQTIYPIEVLRLLGLN